MDQSCMYILLYGCRLAYRYIYIYVVCMQTSPISTGTFNKHKQNVREWELHTFPTPIKPAPQASPILTKPPLRVGSRVTQVNILIVIQILFFLSNCICSYQEILSSKYTCDIVPSQQFHAGLSLWSTDLLTGLPVLYLLETVLRTTI